LEEYLWFGRFGKERDGNRYQKQYINVYKDLNYLQMIIKIGSKKNFKNAL
jgi:hypothetical protein